MKRAILLIALMLPTHAYACTTGCDASDIAALISNSARVGANIASVCALEESNRVMAEDITAEEANAEMESCIAKRFAEEGLDAKGAMEMVKSAMSGDSK